MCDNHGGKFAARLNENALHNCIFVVFLASAKCWRQEIWKLCKRWKRQYFKGEKRLRGNCEWRISGSLACISLVLIIFPPYHPQLQNRKIISILLYRVRFFYPYLKVQLQLNKNFSFCIFSGEFLKLELLKAKIFFLHPMLIVCENILSELIDFISP